MTEGRNTAHSIRRRLYNHAQARRESFELVMLRYANERLLHRLSRSEYKYRFLLKGATLFLLWNDNRMHRPTRDVDLLAVRVEDAENLRLVFRALCEVDESDGLVFDAASVTVAPIREESRYGGQRVKLRAALHGARIALQFDIGFGDAVTPGPEWRELPVLLDGMAAPLLMTYPVYTVIAEKLEAMAQLGYSNSRMKDFYDVDFLLAKFELDGPTLQEAVRRTFARRGTPIPDSPLQAFDPLFEERRRELWHAFLERHEMDREELEFGKVLARLRHALSPIIDALGTPTGSP